MKLELKHLAPYLPYGLKLLVESDGFLQNDEIFILNAITQNGVNVSTKSFPFNTDYCFEEFKPILRPLTDLTKVIEWDDGKYMMTDWDDFDLEETSYDTVQDYLAKHFDIFGLIPQGLAIDINTLK
jgi:hypothetical protein